MGKRRLAKIAVSAAVYSIDKPYVYLIPETLQDKVEVGVRVTVPFGNRNTRSEGFVLALELETDRKEIKSIESVLDDEPVLTEKQVKLGIWMHDRFFCTVYSALRAMLPVGMWFKDGKQRVSEKTQKYAILDIPPEEALVLAGQKRMRAPHQATVLNLLVSIGEGACNDICRFSGATTASLKALEKQGYIHFEMREVFRYHHSQANADVMQTALNDEQHDAFSGIYNLMLEGKPNVALLYGVTGSGKTSIYIELAKGALSQGKRTIILVPEISLTPQAVSRFSLHFGEKIAVLHSSLTMGERYDEWRRIKSGEVMVVIGTRSAIFAPVEELGLIVIDEEQEYTYKSDNNPRYSTREVAKYLCVKSNAVLVLGSATPSVESMYFASQGKYKFFKLKNRYNSIPLPSVSIVNMREELRHGNQGIYSGELKEELSKNIEVGEQSILFINRRGSSTSVVCGECGYTFMCPNCSVAMTHHSYEHRMICHYCGHNEPVPSKCPKCGGKLKFLGTGTQKAEEEFRTLFPEVELIRMDSDSVARAGSHERLLEEFRDSKIPVLLGTQMITKGLDFENVTLVGVLDADQSLYSGSFRARERTFSLITQVVGRSGRGEKRGRAIIQSLTPENETITLAASQDYESFFKKEIELRRILSAPPISDMIDVIVSGQNETQVLRGCVKLLETFKNYFTDVDANVIGPSPDGVIKVNNRYRYKLIIIGRNTRRMRDTVSHVLKEFLSDKEFRGLSAYADAEPTD